MGSLAEIITVSLLGLAVTSSNMIGAALGLYLRPSKRLLSCILAFAAGALISALAIELAYDGAMDLHLRGFRAGSAWEFVGGGFAVGAVLYYVIAVLLDGEGAAIRFPRRFREYAHRRQRRNAAETIRLLSQGDLMRHLPPEAIGEILPLVMQRSFGAGEVVFNAGDEGDALYIIARGKVDVVEGGGESRHSLAELGPGQAFGEMALLSGASRTATIRATVPTDLLEIKREDFIRLMSRDRQLAAAARRLSHERAIRNLSSGGDHPEVWARVASDSLGSHEPTRFQPPSRGGGPGRGSSDRIREYPRYDPWLSGHWRQIRRFLEFIPDADPRHVPGRHSGSRGKRGHAEQGRLSAPHDLPPLVRGPGHGRARRGGGKGLYRRFRFLTAIFCQAVAGGAVLALITHAMIPEAIEEAGSLIVLPTVVGFLVALYPALAESFG